MKIILRRKRMILTPRAKVKKIRKPRWIERNVRGNMFG